MTRARRPPRLGLGEESPPVLGEAREPQPVSLLRAWWEAVGPTLARVAAPRGVTAGRLRIVVPDRPWEKQLSAVSNEILSRLRASKGLADLRGIDILVEEPAASPFALPEEPRPPVGEVRPPPEILAAAEAIPDADLARRWVEAVTRLLTRAGDSRRP